MKPFFVRLIRIQQCSDLRSSPTIIPCKAFVKNVEIVLGIPYRECVVNRGHKRGINEAVGRVKGRAMGRAFMKPFLKKVVTKI